MQSDLSTFVFCRKDAKALFLSVRESTIQAHATCEPADVACTVAVFRGHPQTLGSASPRVANSLLRNKIGRLFPEIRSLADHGYSTRLFLGVRPRPPKSASPRTGSTTCFAEPRFTRQLLLYWAIVSKGINRPQRWLWRYLAIAFFCSMKHRRATEM